ncbi:MAG: OmpA family protein, partial [Polyangiales bacterium]
TRATSRPRSRTPGVPSTDPARSGCPSKVVRIRNRKIEAVNATVYFDFDDDKVRNESMPVLRAIADVIQAATFIDHVRIDGHTDAQGSQSYNLELSRRRAQSIAKTLHRMGVGEERLRVSEYGEAKPADSNVTEEGRAANRRVEFHIVTKQQRRAIQPKRPGQ